MQKYVEIRHFREHRHIQVDTVDTHMHTHDTTKDTMFHTVTCMSVYTHVHGYMEAHIDTNAHTCRDVILTRFKIHMQRLAEM